MKLLGRLKLLFKKKFQNLRSITNTLSTHKIKKLFSRLLNFAKIEFNLLKLKKTKKSKDSVFPLKMNKRVSSKDF